LKLEVQLGNAMPDVTGIERGQVTHFVEKIPSVNDILFKQ
jgi:ABC-2 type transport system ATP-binding protein